MKTPDFLVIGHVTQDTIIKKNLNYQTFGGTSLYSAILAREFGLKTAIFTSARRDFPFNKILKNVFVKNISSEKNTEFENNYLGKRRVQYIRSSANAIEFSMIPKEWLDCKIVFLAPIFNEFLSFPKIFKKSFVGCNLQGWIRKKDFNNKIYLIENWHHLDLSGIDLLVFSDEDVKKENWGFFASKVKYVAVTSGSKGVYFSVNGEWNHVSSYPTNSLDSTGAGDVWTSTFMIYFYETKDILLSSKMANAAASLSIENLGYSNIPGREKVKKRFLK
ncbi:MAG: hypothetical protein CL764_02030 [Chloroflexi bacterium]|nr:hypothetical protein [Chloroflexota bacterium]